VVEPLSARQPGGDTARLVIDPYDELTPGPLVPGPGSQKDERKSLLRLGSHPLSGKTMKGFATIFHGTS
jgi:hypothetical protein